jgi:hypothetical protein
LGEGSVGEEEFLSDDLFERLLNLFLDELTRAQPDDISQVLVGVAKKGFDIDGKRKRKRKNELDQISLLGAGANEVFFYFTPDEV